MLIVEDVAVVAGVVVVDDDEKVDESVDQVSDSVCCMLVVA